jgi:hypothetical protein
LNPKRAQTGDDQQLRRVPGANQHLSRSAPTRQRRVIFRTEGRNWRGFWRLRQHCRMVQ